MCYRFAFAPDAKEFDFRAYYQLVEMLAYRGRYNIAPTQPIVAVRHNGDKGRPEATFLNWGLVPSWAKDVNMGAKLANARSETVMEKPSFRDPFRRRRCIIPASGFYEWQTVGKLKQPWYFSSPGGEPLNLAGIWEHWQSADGSEIESCSILTTVPNGVMEPFHNRMPVILDKQDIPRWLETEERKAKHLTKLLKPCPDANLTCWPVSPDMNNVRNDNPDMIEKVEIPFPASDNPEQFELF